MSLVSGFELVPLDVSRFANVSVHFVREEDCPSSSLYRFLDKRRGGSGIGYLVN